MMKEGPPQFPPRGPEQGPHDENMRGLEGIPDDAIERAKNFSQAVKTWEALEKNEQPRLIGDPASALGVIDALRFLKENHSRRYAKEEEKEQFKKVDAYIEQLKKKGK